MKTNKGFTLIEIAVVLAIIAILAAILTPIVTSYIDQARVTRANADTKKIAEAALLFKRDTGVFPGYDTYAHATAGGTAGLISCLTSDGNASNTAIAAISGTPCAASTGALAYYLNSNTMGFFTNNSSTETIGGGIKFRGPYLDGLAGLDPWGTPYLMTSKNFANPANPVASYAFVVSAGPNVTFDTTFSQSKSPANGVVFTTSSDDITALIN